MSGSGAGLKVTKYLARPIIILVGLAAVAWGASVLPVFRQQASSSAVAAKLLRGYTFKGESLSSEARKAEAAAKLATCDVTASHSLYVLRLAILNESIAANDQVAVKAGYDALNDAIGRALACSPADAFAWLTLFWLDVVKQGLKPENATYLRLSYALGPNKSWIGLRRNKLAFALFDQLPKDLADNAVDEFIKLLDTNRLDWESATVFEKLPVTAQNRILEHLASANAIARRGFADAVHRKGLESPVEPRPWR